MADNTTLNAMTGGDVIASDDIAGVKHQQVKVEFGADGTATPVSSANPLPSAVNQSKSIIDSSVANLAAAAVYTTQWFSNELGGTNYQVTAKADQPLTITHEPSWNGSTAAYSHDHFMDAGRTYSRPHGSFAPYHRYKFTNTGGSTTTSVFLAVTQSFAPQHQVEACPNEDLTITPLAGGATYTSGIYYSKYRSNGAALFGKADQGGAVYLDGSHNSIDWEILATYAYTAGDVFHKNILVESAYFRLRWVNDVVAQGSFKFHILQKADPNSDIVSFAEDANEVQQGADAPWSMEGEKASNAVAPGATNLGVLPAVATAAAPSYTEGNQVAASSTLSGDTRVTLDGESVAVTGTFWQTTQPVSAAGTVAHGTTDSGNPIKVGAKVETQLSTVTIEADADRTDLYADSDGVQFVKLFPEADSITERVADTGGTSTAFTNFGATASARNLVYVISVFNASATGGYVDFRDGAAGSILFTVPAPAGGGAVLCSSTPIFKTTANTALAYDVSGALTTVYISISGRKSKVT